MMNAWKRTLVYMTIFVVLTGLVTWAQAEEAAEEEFVELDVLLALLPERVHAPATEVARLGELLIEKYAALQEEEEVVLLFPLEATMGVIELGLDAGVETEQVAGAVIKVAMAARSATEEARWAEIRRLGHLAREATAEYVTRLGAILRELGIDAGEMAQQAKIVLQRIWNDTVVPLIEGVGEIAQREGVVPRGEEETTGEESAGSWLREVRERVQEEVIALRPAVDELLARLGFQKGE